LTNGSNNSNTEDVHAVAIVEGKLFNEDSIDGPCHYSSRWWIGGFLAVAIIIVITGVCASGKCSAKSSLASTPILNTTVTLPPTMSPSETPVDILVERTVAAFVNEISLSEDEIPVNGTTPESRALAWLIREDKLFNDSTLMTLDAKIETDVSFRIRQRFPLVTLWYQQVDEEGAYVKNWATTLGWLEYDNECEWYGLNCTSFDLGENVGEQHVVTGIDFYVDMTESSMNFAGTIPPDIGLLTSLTLLDFKSNRVTGSLPESIGYCSHLEVLDLSECLVAGTLPSSIGKLTAMFFFDVSDNGFYGTIPPSTEQWLNVTYMYLRNNGFSGSLPDFVGRWTALHEWDFYDNGFTGTIPQTIGLLTALESLNLGSNDLGGTLPSTIGEFANISFFIVSSNYLQGTIPGSVGSWSKIQYAYFYGNPFTGTVPNQICSFIDPLTDEVVVDCQLNCTCCSYLVNCTANP
jgi:hypothetical protein